MVIAAHRNHRPWIGETVGPAAAGTPRHVADCAFCPGNERVHGDRNPDYEGVFVFDNDHPSVGPDAPGELAPPPGIYRNRPATGLSRVVCYHPRHDATLAQLSTMELLELLRVWQAQTAELGARPEVDHVLIFENKGEVVGVSNPHPHCQVYATNFVFKTMANEAEVSARYWRDQGRVLFQDVIASEREVGSRVLSERDGAISFVPYFARYAYETFVSPRAAHASIVTLDPGELHDLATVLSETLIRFDNLWRMPFPYVMALHQAPTDGKAYEGFQFHIEFHPPLRKPGLLKYLAGPEVGGGSFLSDTCPEEKAAELRATALTHYTQQRTDPAGPGPSPREDGRQP